MNWSDIYSGAIQRYRSGDLTQRHLFVRIDNQTIPVRSFAVVGDVIELGTDDPTPERVREVASALSNLQPGPAGHPIGDGHVVRAEAVRLLMQYAEERS